MKKLRIVSVLISALITITELSAQTPEKFNYQAVCRDNSGNIIAGQPVQLRFTIYNLAPGGTILYKETHNTTTSVLGLVNVAVGGGAVDTGSFVNIDWANGDKYLEVELNAGSGFNSIGTMQLISVPYALHAKTADTKITAGNNVSVTGTGTITNPFVISATTGSGPAHYVGELFGGGVVFWVDHTGTHGLICSMIDLSTSQDWSNVNVLIGPTAQNDWNGQGNTAAIVGQPGHISSAAKLCDDYTNLNYGTGIFSDWYLPSIGELNHLWNNFYEVQKALENDGNPATTAIVKDYYWSSTEEITGNAHYFNFSKGTFEENIKSVQNYVRAVRKF